MDYPISLLLTLGFSSKEIAFASFCLVYYLPYLYASSQF